MHADRSVRAHRRQLELCERGEVRARALRVVQERRSDAHPVWRVRVESEERPARLRRHGVLRELGGGGESTYELECFRANTRYDSEKGEFTNHIFIHLSLKSKLSHGESALLLLLTKSLLSSLHSHSLSNSHLLLGKSTAHGTSGLHTEVSGKVLSLGVVFLELDITVPN